MDAGRLVIISGPSGAGKTTVIRALLRDCPLPLSLSVSATTRPPRPGEDNGVDYYFLKKSEFEERRNSGAFLECFEVFGRGYWYGTLRSEIERICNLGRWPLLEIDVQGMQAVVRIFPEAITVFVRPQSLEELELRLRNRGTESEDTIQRRLEVARHEWQSADQYQYDIINNSIDQAARDICQALQQFPTQQKNSSSQSIP